MTLRLTIILTLAWIVLSCGGADRVKLGDVPAGRVNDGPDFVRVPMPSQIEFRVIACLHGGPSSPPRTA